jgi:integrase
MSAPGILSDDAVRKLREITLTSGKTAHKRHIALRDHTIYALALGVGLREFEIAALKIADAYEEADGVTRARSWVMLRVFKGSNRKPRKSKTRTEAQQKALAKRAAERAAKRQRVYFPAPVRAALDAFLEAKRARRESVSPDAPVFMGHPGKPVSERLLRHNFALWQIRANVKHNRFHNMRHTAITRYWGHTKDLKAVQDFSRHASLATTQQYLHTEDEYRERTGDALAERWG